ncbi:ATP-binding protein [Candidatus Binatus sp.]|uniref:ATP-binding protein n=1 Tax=Candidatus Binatus sp. TaxID=2811406 RepID=UPI002FDB02FF
MAGKEHRSTPLRVLRPAESGPPEAGERFIGRERELGEIRAAMDGALSGRGLLLLFSGEPGIGKTRLADEAGARAVLRDRAFLMRPLSRQRCMPLAHLQGLSWVLAGTSYLFRNRG